VASKSGGAAKGRDVPKAPGTVPLGLGIIAQANRAIAMAATFVGPRPDNALAANDD
jgi:hypothetical protein